MSHRFVSLPLFKHVVNHSPCQVKNY